MTLARLPFPVSNLLETATLFRETDSDILQESQWPILGALGAPGSLNGHHKREAKEEKRKGRKIKREKKEEKKGKQKEKGTGGSR